MDLTSGRARLGVQTGESRGSFLAACSWATDGDF